MVSISGTASPRSRSARIFRKLPPPLNAMASTPACSLPRCQTALLVYLVDSRACGRASCAFCAPPRCSGAPLPRARAKRSSRLAGAQAATPLGRRRPIAPASHRGRRNCAGGPRKVESQPEGDLSTRNQEAGRVVPAVADPWPSGEMECRWRHGAVLGRRGGRAGGSCGCWGRGRVGRFAGRRAVAVGGGVGKWNLASSVAPGLRGAPWGVGLVEACMLALSTSPEAFAMGAAPTLLRVEKPSR